MRFGEGKMALVPIIHTTSATIGAIGSTTGSTTRRSSA
jgi:hypothetical protein